MTTRVNRRKDRGFADGLEDDNNVEESNPRN